MLPSLFFCFLLLYLIVALGNTAETCDLNFNLMKNNKIVDIVEMCKTVPCLTKCCAESQIFFNNGTDTYCESTSYLEKTYNVSNLDDYSELEIYGKVKRETIKTKKNISNFTIIHYENFILCDYRQEIYSFNYPYVLENGRMELWFKSSKTGVKKMVKSLEMGEFCFENTFSATSHQIEFYQKVKNPRGDQDKVERAVIVANCMMMSCVFMGLVLVVYSLLKELRNLAGIILMAYVATFMAFFLLRIVHVYAYHYNMLKRQGCIILTLLVYYTLLSSFCWMNIMSFDIWWTFRAIRNKMITNRRGILVKFAWYGLYGWGAPLLATSFAVVADHVDLPGIMKPQIFEGGGCFFGEYTYKYYVNCALALLVSVNFVWFGFTAYNVWSVHRAMTLYKEICDINKKNETRFLLYVKLTLLMGLCRIFDAIPVDHWICYTIDGLNACSGLFIFILFVCKKKIYLRLCARLSTNNKLVQAQNRSFTRSTLVTNTHSTKSEPDTRARG